jgi:DNA-binding HxlR family transcriptional regulator
MVSPAEHELETLLQFLKVLGDNTRLRIISLLINRVHSVGELAEQLGLSEPTVSHHLKVLREAGLLNLRAVGTSRLYRFNDEYFERIKRTLLTQETLARIGMQMLIYRTDEDFRQEMDQQRAQAEAWLDGLDVSEADRKVLRDYTHNGRLTQIPTREKKLLVVLRWLAAQFEPDRRYTEPEVNAVLSRYHDDFASLRRALIEFQFLARESGGRMYWRAPQPA